MSIHVLHKVLFELGQIVATDSIATLMTNYEIDVYELLQRHAKGDWGDLDDTDKKSNDRALRSDRMILSSYTLDSGKIIWIKTEHDRSVTTLMLPEEW